MVIGITGGFCTGKSSVAKIFKKLGARLIDLDRFAHTVLTLNPKCFKKIINEFGERILVNNRIRRYLLGQEVFGNKNKLAKLNSIIHPEVIKKMRQAIRQLEKSNKLIVVEAPLLFEAKIRKYFDYVVVVKADKGIQIKRALKNTKLTKKEVLKRINSQWPLRRKIQMADFIIDNNGSLERAAKQVKELWDNLKKN